jgi:hypothetical protein
VHLSTRRLLDPLGVTLILFALGFAYARTLAPGLTWANDGVDGGDFATAAATLGVAHPTGYPTYLLALRLFQLLPAGDLAFRTNLCSAVAALLTALCVYAIVRRMPAGCRWHSSAAALAAALGLGFSGLFWSQAVITEVYTLNALFSALILLFTLEASTAAGPASGWRDRLQALVVGLALGGHITVAVLAAAWLALTTARTPAQARARATARRLAWAGLGLLVYLYLPLRAAAHPPVNWGAPYTWEGFWWVISGQPYRDLAFGLPSNLLYGRIGAWAALLLQQFGWIGLIIGLFGLIYGGSGARGFVYLTAGAALVYSVFAMTYNTSDSFAYLIPAYLVFAIWIGLGVIKLLDILPSQTRSIAPLVAALLIAALAWPAPATARRVDASRDTRAITFATTVLSDAPERAIVLTSGDGDSFALWYYHYALRARPDLVIAVAPLLESAWYRDTLRATYPTLQLPERPSGSWEAALAAANPRLGPLCRTHQGADTPLTCADEHPQFAARHRR